MNVLRSFDLLLPYSVHLLIQDHKKPNVRQAQESTQEGSFVTQIDSNIRVIYFSKEGVTIPLNNDDKRERRGHGRLYFVHSLVGMVQNMKAPPL